MSWLKFLAGLGLCAVTALMFSSSPASSAASSYVGSKTCGDCHPNEYKSFTQNAKKAKSFHSILIMAPGLTQDELKGCYACHTTGYGSPGGFVSQEKTPELANAGCEVCHGPGSAHAESGGDKALIKAKLAVSDCTGCHNQERVKSFNFKPMLYGGAH